MQIYEKISRIVRNKLILTFFIALASASFVAERRSSLYLFGALFVEFENGLSLLTVFLDGQPFIRERIDDPNVLAEVRNLCLPLLKCEYIAVYK